MAGASSSSWRVLGLLAVVATDQIVPATSAHQAQLRVWLASRAAGIVALVLLAIQIVIGLVLSHPTNKAVWRVSRVVFPWHDSLWLFALAFVAAHIVSIVVDPWAGVGLAGAILPGLSAFRTAPVALGTLAMYALLVTGMTARWTRLLPPGAWLIIHRAGIGVFVLAWMHGLLAGHGLAGPARAVRRPWPDRRRPRPLIASGPSGTTWTSFRGGPQTGRASCMRADRAPASS